MTNNNDFETIKPTEIPLTQPPMAAEPEQTNKLPQKLIVGSWLLGALLLALAVIFVLPEMVKPTATLPQKAAQEDASFSSNTTQATTKPAESPWREAQLAKARRSAQDIFAKLLERQQYLENKSITQWAAERYQQGLNAAANGDQAFRKREFDAALSSYNDALDIFTELEQRANQTLSETLSAGEQAIIDGDAANAKLQFELALAIQPGNAAAITGLARTETLPEVLALLETAAGHQQAQPLEQAEQLYQQALQLDPLHQGAKQGLASVKSAIVDRDYIAALSRGYTQLEQGQLAAARSAFNQALKLKPNSSDAKTALGQVSTKQRRLTLQQRLATAKQREQEESWRAAETLYNQILSNDNSVVDARVGQIRSRTRAELDEKLQELINNPLRLSNSNVFQEGQKTLQQARKVEPKGPKMTKQIALVQTILIKAATPWPVEFMSDSSTIVTLFRVGELGQFDSKVVKLKPGRYVVAGTRKGFRDVRIEFVVTGAESTGPIVIQCKDRI